MHCCYIIFSEKLNRHYIGACHDDVHARVNKHNAHEYGDHRYTSRSNDWKLVFVIECASYAQALKIEKHIKGMKSSIYIQNLLKYPEMIQKLKDKMAD